MSPIDSSRAIRRYAGASRPATIARIASSVIWPAGSSTAVKSFAISDANLTAKMRYRRASMNPLAANQMRWRHQPGHYEVWYATFSHFPSKTGFWIRYTMESPKEGHGAPYAQLWFARFDRNDPEKTFGINQKFPLDQMKVQAPFRVQIGDSELRHDGMRGRLGGAEWDLKWQPSEHLHRHLPDLAYRGRWADTQVLSPNLNVAAHGLVTVEGERYELKGAPLGQTHLWG